MLLLPYYFFSFLFVIVFSSNTPKEPKWFECPIFEEIPLEITNIYDSFDEKSIFMLNSEKYDFDLFDNMFWWNSTFSFKSKEKHYTDSFDKDHHPHIGECGFLESDLQPEIKPFSTNNTNHSKINVFVKRKLSSRPTNKVFVVLLSESQHEINTLQSISQTIYQESFGQMDVYYLYHRGLTKYTAVHCPPYDKDYIHFDEEEIQYCQEFIYQHLQDYWPYFSIDYAAYDLYMLLKTFPSDKEFYLFASNYNTLWSRVFQQMIPTFDEQLSQRVCSFPLCSIDR